MKHTLCNAIGDREFSMTPSAYHACLSGRYTCYSGLFHLPIECIEMPGQPFNVFGLSQVFHTPMDYEHIEPPISRASVHRSRLLTTSRSQG